MRKSTSQVYSEVDIPEDGPIKAAIELLDCLLNFSIENLLRTRDHIVVCKHIIV